MRLIDDRDKVEDIDIRCTNCKKETGLYLKTSTLKEMTTKFLLNAILYHVGMLGIICSNGKMKYERDESNHPDWLNKSPWYNTAIYSRLHVSMFKYFIAHTRTNRYNLLCSLVAYAKTQAAHENKESSIGDSIIHKHVTI